MASFRDAPPHLFAPVYSVRLDKLGSDRERLQQLIFQTKRQYNKATQRKDKISRKFRTWRDSDNDNAPDDGNYGRITEQGLSEDLLDQTREVNRLAKILKYYEDELRKLEG